LFARPTGRRTKLLAVENFRPLWSTPLFLAPRGFVRHDPGYIVRDGEITSEYTLNRTGYGVDIGALVSNKAEVRFGYQQSKLKVDQRIGNVLAPQRNGQEEGIGLLVTVDTQTSPMVPTRGFYFKARLDRVLETADIVLADGTRFDEVGPFTRAEMNGSWFKRVGQRGRGFVSGGAGSAFDAVPLEPYNFTLGGPFRLGALVTGEVSGPKYMQVTTGYLHQFGQLPSLLGGPMYVGGWLETGSAFAKISDSYWNKNVSTGIILESIVGPIFGAVSIDVNGDFRYYISIGRLFR
jgi:NTE family protein